MEITRYGKQEIEDERGVIRVFSPAETHGCFLMYTIFVTKEGPYTKIVMKREYGNTELLNRKYGNRRIV
jgi:hypothetical protein